ncbi:MAG TPA: sigma 54-interacting transcriptional regulator [Candidatus Eisenbacteria bacterium]|nr:sigma 54-interacting transcriptional regulator [Candidatus Eisenbacteria bacterium]
MSSKPGSYSSGKSGEGGGALPSARLIGLHRHSLTNVLIVGGNEALREQVARAFHRESPLGGGAFAIVNCAREEDRLRTALLDWTEGGEQGVNPLQVAEQGTLYLDMVEHLDLDTQRLLLALARQIQGEPAIGAQGARAGRLVVGNPRGLADLAADGRFMPALYDALDKVRVELGPTVEPST